MKYLIIIACLLLGYGCDQPKENEASTQGQTPAAGIQKQLNLTILLDLSDRIDPEENPATPGHFERDSTLISYFTSYFLDEMREKGTFMAKGKMRVIFSPNPPDAGINQAVKRMNIDLSKVDMKGKKLIYDNLQHTVAENISNIYRAAITQSSWPGSDIWRFFKNDIKDIAVDEDSSYRNLLVIFTDGYIYHQDSRDAEEHRYAYLLPELFDKYKFRNNSNWASEMDKLDFGLISRRSDLNHLEVLVLEVSPSLKNRSDEDRIRKVLDKWFSEMKVAKWKIINSDLPELTMQKIGSFLKG